MSVLPLSALSCFTTICRLTLGNRELQKETACKHELFLSNIYATCRPTRRTSLNIGEENKCVCDVFKGFDIELSLRTVTSQQETSYWSDKADRWSAANGTINEQYLCSFNEMKVLFITRTSQMPQFCSLGYRWIDWLTDHCVRVRDMLHLVVHSGPPERSGTRNQKCSLITELPLYSNHIKVSVHLLKLRISIGRFV